MTLELTFTLPLRIPVTEIHDPRTLNYPILKYTF